MNPLRRWRLARARWPSWTQTLTRGRVLVPLGLVVAVLAAFLTYGAITRIGPTKFSRGGAFGVEPPSPQAGSSPETVASSSPGLTPGASPSATPSAVPSSGSTSGPTPGPRPSPSPGAVFPVTGSYGVRVQGSERVKFGPLSFCERDFPDTSTLGVKPAEGEGPSAFDFDHTFSSLHSERHIYRYSPGSIMLLFEGAQVSCGGIEQGSETSFSPPEEKVRLPVRAGASWSGSAGDAERTEAYSARVLRTERLSVSGRAFTVFVIETSIEMTGQESGRRFQRWWFAPELAMPLKWYEEIEAARMGATYSMEATFTITSLP